MPVQLLLLDHPSSADSLHSTYYQHPAAVHQRLTAQPASPLPSPSLLLSDSSGSSAATSPLLASDYLCSAALCPSPAYEPLASPGKRISRSPLFMSFSPLSPAPAAALPAALSAAHSATPLYQQQQLSAQFQTSTRPLHFAPPTSLQPGPPHSQSMMAPQQQPHSQQQPPTHQSPYPQQSQQPHAAATSATAAFPYPTAPVPFLPSGNSGQSPHPHSHHPPLFSNPFLSQPQPPRMSPPPGGAAAAAAVGNVQPANQFSFGVGGPSQQSLITAQGSSYFLSNPHLSAVPPPHLQHGDEALFGRSPSPLRPLHLGGQPLSLLSGHQQPMHALSLASPSLLLHQANAAAAAGQPLFIHPASHPSAAGGAGGAHSLSLPSLHIQQYLAPQQQQLGSTAAPSFFSSHPPSLPAPYSSMASVPPSAVPSTRWHCPGGCGKVLNKRSFRSLKKHKSICVLYMGWAKKNGAAGGKQSSANNATASSSATGARESKKADSRQKREHRDATDEAQLAEAAALQQRVVDDEAADEAQEEVASSAPSKQHAAKKEGDNGDSPSKRQRREMRGQQQQLLGPDVVATVPMSAGGGASSSTSSSGSTTTTSSTAPFAAASVDVGSGSGPAKPVVTTRTQLQSSYGLMASSPHSAEQSLTPAKLS